MKKQRGITIIALTIIIIVILILAGVTIITLIGGNRQLQKAQSNGEQAKVVEIEEKIKLIYEEYQISKYGDKNKSAGEYLKQELEKIYGDRNVDIISQEDSIVLKVIENGEAKFYEYNPNTDISRELKKGINYNGKKISEIRSGDNITIVTENFKVFGIKNKKIKAMPYYNITLTDNPVQSKNAGKTTFSTRPYWSTDENGEEIENWSDKADEIDMSDPDNNIQQYITKYKDTLKNYGAEKIEIRAARRSEFDKESSNPGSTGSFWIASCTGNLTQLFVTWERGNIGGANYYGKRGVRPVIEIPME